MQSSVLRSALEEELDVLPQQVLDLLGEGAVARPAGVVVEEALRGGAGELHVLRVARQAPQLQVAEPRLALAEDLPRAADLEVALGEDEAVGRLLHRLHPRGAVGGARIGEQVAPRLRRATADAAPELVELRQAEAVGVL